MNMEYYYSDDATDTSSRPITETVVDTHESVSNTYSSSFSGYSESLSEGNSSSSTEDVKLGKENGMQKQFLKSMIKRTKQNASTMKFKRENIQPTTELQNNIPTVEFCQHKLFLLENIHRNKIRTEDYLKTQQETKPCKLPISKSRLEELKIENIHHRMRQKLDELNQHDTRTCQTCVKTQEELVHKNFVKSKKTHLQKHLIEERVEQQLQFKTSISMIGELASSLPRPSDDPKHTWSNLFNRSMMR